MQCDADEITEEDAIALSAVALADGGGLGFRLYNHHHPTEVPMVAWRRCQPSAAAYRAVLEKLDLPSLIERDDAPIVY